MSSSSKPWTRVSLDRAVLEVPGMLGLEERQLLHWLASEEYRGDGEILDVGAFLGASAAALGSGVRDNPRPMRKHERIRSYDFFAWEDFYADWLSGPGWTPGADTLPFYRRATAHAATSVVPVKGDVTAQPWDGRPIEILFLDFTQTAAHHDHVARTFYPSLLPEGRSWLVHQDWMFTVCWWLHVFMEHFAGAFELADRFVPNATAVWRVVKPLPEEAVTRPLGDLLPFDAMLPLFDRSMRRYEEEPWRGLLECARVRMLLHGRGRDVALEAAAELERRYAQNALLVPHVAILLRDVRGFVPETSVYRAYFRA